MELKAEFSAGRIQAYPDFDSDEPFILAMDWSSLNIAGVLSQKQEGVERFLGCWGRRFALRDLLVHILSVTRRRELWLEY